MPHSGAPAPHAVIGDESRRALEDVIRSGDRLEDERQSQGEGE